MGAIARHFRFRPFTDRSGFIIRHASLICRRSADSLENLICTIISFSKLSWLFGYRARGRLKKETDDARYGVR